MATRVRGSVTGYVVALVVFVALTLVGLIAAVVLYAQLSSEESQKNQALDDSRKYKPSDPTNPTFVAVTASAAGKKPVDVLLDELIHERNKTVGEKYVAADRAGFDAAMTTDAKLTEGQTLLAELQRLNTQLADGKKAADAAAAAKAEYDKNLKDLRAHNTTLESTVSQYKTQLDGQMKQYDTALAAVKAQNQTEFTRLSKLVGDVQVKWDADSATKTAEIDRLNRELNECKTQNDTLMSARGIRGGDATLQPDGVVLSLVPGEDVVYLSIGRAEHLTLGTTFQVFDPKGLGRKRLTDDALTGKATVEVISLNDHTSEARIVRLDRGASVNKDDVIINLVYDPNMVMRFYIFGDFDIDNTGATSPEDNKRLEAMVKSWGGETLREFTYQADFLVLGKPPTLPEKPDPSVVDPRVLEDYVNAERRWKTYQELTAEAQRKGIPILNQNRFLTLIGYYQRVPSGAAIHH